MINHKWSGHTYRIIINIFFVFWYLRWIEEVEKTITLFSLNYWLCIFRPLLWFFLKNLLCQACSGMPFNLCPAIIQHDIHKQTKTIVQIKCGKCTKKKASKWTNYPIAFSSMGSSSSIIWYVFVRTEFLKKGFVSKKNSSLKPLGSSSLDHLISLRYFRASTSFSEIWRSMC